MDIKGVYPPHRKRQRQGANHSHVTDSSSGCLSCEYASERWEMKPKPLVADRKFSNQEWPLLLGFHDIGFLVDNVSSAFPFPFSHPHDGVCRTQNTLNESPHFHPYQSRISSSIHAFLFSSFPTSHTSHRFQGSKDADLFIRHTLESSDQPLLKSPNAGNEEPDLNEDPSPPLRPLTALKWPYIPEESAYPDPLKRDDPKALQLHQYEAIGLSCIFIFLHTG